MRILPSLCALLFGSTLALAQPGDVVPDSTRGATLRDSIVLRQVIVSATRLAEPLARVPYAVTTINGRTRSQGVSLGESLRMVPGLQVDNRSNFAVGDRIAMRGVGARSQFGVRGVKILVDGVPATFADGQSALDAIDPRFIESAQVIRGATSMLYGNAAGGAILMSTEGGPGSRVGVSLVGDGGPVSAHARAVYPLGDGSIRYLGSQVVYDGWREHSDASVSRHLLGAGLVLGEGDSLRLRASYTSLEASNPGSLALDLFTSTPQVANRTNVTQETGKELEQIELSATLSRAGDLRLDAGLWGIFRNVDNPIIGRTILLDRVALGSRLSVAAGSDADWLRWALGADVDVQIDERINMAFPRSSNRVVLDQREWVASAGPFGLASVAIAPELSLSLALRGDIVSFNVQDHLVDSLDPDDSGSRTMTALSPSLGIAWMPLHALTVFANVATGFETPTTTELANRPDGAGGFNPGLEPQRSLSFEAGMRGRLVRHEDRLVGPISFEVVLYHLLIDDELIPFELDDAAGRSYFRNAGSATHRGLEMSLEVEDYLVKGLDFRLAGSLTDARFREFTADGVRYDDNRIPGVASSMMSVDLEYRASDIVVGLDVRALGSMAVDDANSAKTSETFVFGAHLAFEGLRFDLAGRPVTLVPWLAVENFLDESYAASIVPNAAGGRYYEPGRPRAFYGGLELRAE